MYSFFIFVTVVFLSFNTSAGAGTCVSADGTNNTCEAACLKQSCDDTKWSCNGTLLSTCEQSCYHNLCTRLTCDKTTQKCVQYCNGCQSMKCNSSDCEQHCTAGYCDNMTCNTAYSCQQSCYHCRQQRCYDTTTCTQRCLESDCSLECVQSQTCRQYCHGNGCLANCLGNKVCFQSCEQKANCTHLTCDSEFCSQTCANNSMCALLRCHGDYCRQETYVKESKLECLSSDCREQVSHVSNAVLSCDNINGQCVQKCSGSGCVMSCGTNVKTCEQDCYGGDCNMSCARGVKTCTMKCPGGNCTFFCQAKDCLLSCKNNTCKSIQIHENDTREECDNSCNKRPFHPILLLVFTTFTSLTLLYW